MYQWWRVSVAAPGQQQVQDQHVPRPPAAGRLPQRQQLHLCTHTGRAGEVGALFLYSSCCQLCVPPSFFNQAKSPCFDRQLSPHKFAFPLPPFDRFRLRNKKGSGAGRTFPLAQGVMGKTFAVEGGLHADASPGQPGQPGQLGQPGQPGLKAPAESPVALSEVAVPSLSHPQLIPRSPDLAEETNRAAPNGSGTAKPAEQ